jgi:hypothetical protein
MTRHSTSAPGVVLAAFALVACSSTTRSPGAATADLRAAVATPAAGTSAGPSSSVVGADLPAQCKAISDSLALLTGITGPGGAPDLGKAVSRMRQLQATAPPEIRGDIKVIADFDEAIMDAVRSGTRPNLAETPALSAAMRHEATWTARHCGRL